MTPKVCPTLPRISGTPTKANISIHLARKYQKTTMNAGISKTTLIIHNHNPIVCLSMSTASP